MSSVHQLGVVSAYFFSHTSGGSFGLGNERSWGGRGGNNTRLVYSIGWKHIVTTVCFHPSSIIELSNKALTNGEDDGSKEDGSSKEESNHAVSSYA